MRLNGFTKLIILFICLGLIGLFGIRYNGSADVEKNEYRLATATVRDFKVNVRTVGVLDAARSHMVSSSVRGDKGKIIFLIEDGSHVKKGQVIGYVGSTGRSTGAHLHFGLYKRGRAVNPAKHIRIATKKYREVDIFKTKIIKIKGIQKYKDRLIALLEDKPTMNVWNANSKNYYEYKGESK